MRPAPKAEPTDAEPMLVLALDTSGPACAAALARRDGPSLQIVAARSEAMERGHAERLVPLVGALLDEAGASYSDLSRVGVTVGPGSFTGVRVGIAAARGLALALNIPAIGIGTLDAFLEMAAGPEGGKPGAPGTAVACLDARRGEIYVLARDPTSADTVLPAAAMTPLAAARVLVAEARAPLWLVGSGARLLAEALAQIGTGGVTIVSEAGAPDIAAVTRLTAEAGAGSPPVPLYLRAPDAKPQSGGVQLAAAPA